MQYKSTYEPYTYKRTGWWRLFIFRGPIYKIFFDDTAIRTTTELGKSTVQEITFLLNAAWKLGHLAGWMHCEEELKSGSEDAPTLKPWESIKRADPRYPPPL